MNKVIVLILMFFSLTIVAQTGEVKRKVIASAGGIIESENCNVSWTLGEVVAGTFKNPKIIVNQGFQQRPIFPIVIDNPDYKIVVYPNPTSQFIYVFVKSFNENSKAYCKLFNLNGKLLYSTDFVQNNQIIDMEHFPSGAYLLQIEDAFAVVSHSVIIIKE